MQICAAYLYSLFVFFGGFYFSFSLEGRYLCFNLEMALQPNSFKQNSIRNSNSKRTSMYELEINNLIPIYRYH